MNTFEATDIKIKDEEMFVIVDGKSNVVCKRMDKDKLKKDKIL